MVSWPHGIKGGSRVYTFTRNPGHIEITQAFRHASFQDRYGEWLQNLHKQRVKYTKGVSIRSKTYIGRMGSKRQENRKFDFSFSFSL